MHDASMSEMTRILDRWPGHARLLDVGSYDVNGTYRPMVERRGWQYTGMDVSAGPNVCYGDIIALSTPGVWTSDESYLPQQGITMWSSNNMCSVAGTGYTGDIYAFYDGPTTPQTFFEHAELEVFYLPELVVSDNYQ